MRFIFLASMALLVSAANVSLAQNGKNAADALAEVRAVHVHCRMIRADAATRAQTFFEIVDDLASKKPSRWSLTVPAGKAVYSEMKTYSSGGKVRSAVRNDTSPSGDWSKTHAYCFRTDGSLAFIHAVLRTFHGNARVEDRFYFAPGGRQFRKLRSVFDLKTGRMVNPGKAAFMDQEAKIYPDASTLLHAIGQ